jgi:hypothetical protein
VAGAVPQVLLRAVGGEARRYAHALSMPERLRFPATRALPSPAAGSMLARTMKFDPVPTPLPWALWLALAALLVWVFFYGPP